MADDTTTVGSVSVDVVPNAGDFTAKLEGELGSAIEALAQQIGEQIGEAIGQAIRDHMASALAEGGADAAPAGGVAGQSFGESFRSAVELALAALPAVDIDADTSEADLRIELVRQQLEAIHGVTVGVDVTAEEAQAQLAEIRANLEYIAASHTDARVSTDAAVALAELEAVSAKLDEITAQSNAAEMETGLDELATSTERAATTAQDAADGMGKLMGTLLALSPVIAVAVSGLISLAAAGTAAVGGLALFAAVAAPVAAVASGVSGLTGAWEQFESAARPEVMQALESIFRALAEIVPELRPVLDAVSEAVSDFGGALQDVVGSGAFQDFLQFFAGQAGQAIDAFGQILLNLGGAFAALWEAFAPVVAALLGALVSLSQRFEAFAESTDFSKLVSELVADMPQLVTLVGNLGQMFFLLVSAAAPIAGVMLPALNAVAQALNTLLSIPGLGPMIVLFGVLAGTIAVLGPIATTVAETFGIMGAAGAAAGVEAGAGFAAAAPEVLLLVAAVALVAIGIDELASHWSDVTGALSTAWSATVHGVAAGADAVGDFFTTMYQDIVGEFTAMPGEMEQIGEDVVNGLVRGIEDLWDDFMGWLSSLGSAIPNLFKDLLDIHSPSGVMAEIGGNITAGLAEGIDGGASGVQASMAALASGLTGTIATVGVGVTATAAGSTVASLAQQNALLAEQNSLLRGLPGALSASTGGVVRGVLSGMGQQQVVAGRKA